ncbi:MAG: hypothetical protein ACJ79P_14430, partial [Myxococcales bacterium]
MTSTTSRVTPTAEPMTSGRWERAARRCDSDWLLLAALWSAISVSSSSSTSFDRADTGSGFGVKRRSALGVSGRGVGDASRRSLAREISCVRPGPAGDTVRIAASGEGGEGRGVSFLVL